MYEWIALGVFLLMVFLAIRKEVSRFRSSMRDNFRAGKDDANKKEQ